MNFFSFLIKKNQFFQIKIVINILWFLIKSFLKWKFQVSLDIIKFVHWCLLNIFNYKN